MKLIVTRGLPGSGKTTFARAWVAEDPTSRARVNRDDLRDMAHDGVFVKGQTEAQILTARNAAVSALLKRGIDVVVDDTNLPSRVVRDLRRLAAKAGAEFEVVDLTDASLAMCLQRDAARPEPVGPDVISDMHARFVAGKPHPLPIPDEQQDPAPGLYVPDWSLPPAVIVDVDGTVALMGARSPFDESRVHEDRPNSDVVRVVEAAQRAGIEVVFVSARTDGCEAATREWLRDHVALGGAGLYMRSAGDMRKDSIVKAEIFEEHIAPFWNVVGVFDDRRQVVDMWRSMGLTVFHVADGDF